MIHVVVGIIYNAQGEVFIAKRDAHKFQGGRWEFPGGKVEASETPLAALKRELQEELGIDVIDAKAWRQFHHEYSDKSILLDVWHITKFHGQPHGNEGQPVRWVTLDSLTSLEIPDANWEIIEKLRVSSSSK